MVTRSDPEGSTQIHAIDRAVPSDSIGETVGKRTGGIDTYLMARTTAEAVARLIRSEITAGQMRAGSRLRQKEIAERLGVSTTPVREAFKLLQAEGLIRVDAHKGASVQLPSAHDAIELYEMRIALETVAMAKAVPRLTNEDVKAVSDLLAASKTIGGDARFHGRIYSALGWQRLSGLILKLRDASQLYVHATHSSYELGGSFADHKKILAACRARDAEAASEAVRRHLTNAMESIVARLREGSDA